MSQNLTGVQGSRGLVIDYWESRGLREKAVQTAADRAISESRGIRFWIRYFFAEYFWANALLAITFVVALARPAIRSARVQGDFGAAVKRSLDVAGAAVGLILTSPAFAILQDPSG
jgi:hypothetical protein